MLGEAHLRAGSPGVAETRPAAGVTRSESSKLDLGEPLDEAPGSLLTTRPWVTRGGQAHSRSTSKARVSSPVPLRWKAAPSKLKGCQPPAEGPAWE